MTRSPEAGPSGRRTKRTAKLDLREMAWLQPTPVGDMMIVYWESDDPQYVLREIADSQDQFDLQFRQFIQGSAPAIDLDREQPLANSLLFDWQAG